MSAGPILERIDDFDNRLDGMRSELDQLRSAVEATQLTSVTDEAAADETAVPKEPEVASESRDEFVRRSPAAGRLIKSGASPVEQPRPSAQLPSKPRGRSPAAAFDPSSFSVPELFGARTLAWAGGLVTLLGVVFLFVLAADRGWVGPETRLALGGLVSIGLAGSAVYLRRRYGSLVAALSAMGVGLAAGYVTLAAASATYGLLPVALGVALASGLAAFAVSIALRWRSQILAAFALSGAMVALPLIQQGFTPLVGAFLALLFAGAAAVATLRGWRWLLVAAGVVSVIEVAGVALVAALENGDTSPWRPLALAGAFWLLGSGAGVAHALRHTRATPDPFSLAFILGAASLASVSAIFLLDGEALSLPRQGIALLAVAMTQLVAGTLVSRLRSLEIGAPLWGAGLVIGAIAAGQLLDGPALAIAWCGQALLMAWLAIRLRDNRLQLPAIAYATLLAIYALGFEATPRALFEAFDDPAGGAISALLTALALAGLALFAREWTKLATPDVKAEDAPPLGTLALIAETISESGTWLARAALALGTAFATYAASLGILALAEYLEHAKFDFSAAHVVVTAVWALVLGGVALVVRRDATLGPLLVVALGALLAKAVFFDRVHLASDDWPYAFLVAGIGIAWAAVAWSLPTGERGRLDATGAGAILASVGLLSAGLTNAIGYSGPGIDWRGVALLGLAAGYLALAEAVRARTFEFAALTSGVGVALAAAASVVLLDGTWLVLSWAGAAVGFGVLALDSGATRYRLGSLLFAALAFGHVLVFEGRPDRLFVSSDDPGTGALGVLLAAIAVIAAGLAWSRPGRSESHAAAEEWLDSLGRPAKTLTSWIGGGLTLLAVSLGLLQLFQAVGNAEVAELFQRGHVSVSAAWAIAAFGLLWFGASRKLRALRYAGFILFAVTLAKIFLYDLATLSALARAASFIAVGTLLLVAGAFYQRMVEGDGDDEHNGDPAPPSARVLS